MYHIHGGLISVWLTAGLFALDAQQYTKSTYAGGAPAGPMAAMSMALDPSGNLYFVDGYGFSNNPARSNSVFKIDAGGLMSRFFFSSRRRHTRWNCDWSSDVCSSDLRTRAGVMPLTWLKRTPVVPLGSERLKSTFPPPSSTMSMN